MFRSPVPADQEATSSSQSGRCHQEAKSLVFSSSHILKRKKPLFARGPSERGPCAGFGPPSGLQSPSEVQGDTSQVPCKHITPALRTDPRERCTAPNIERLLWGSAVGSPRNLMRTVGRVLCPTVNGETEARWLAQLSSNRSVPGLGPSHRTGWPTRHALGSPWECWSSVPSGSKEKRVASPSLIPYKGRIPRCPEAHGEAAVAVLFALASFAGQSPGCPLWLHPNSQTPQGERESLGRPPGLRGPPWLLFPPRAGLGRTSWGFWLPAPPRAPPVSRSLPGFRLVGCRHLPFFTALFMGSSLCAFPEEAFVFLL